jgi:hypothetical protein
MRPRNDPRKHVDHVRSWTQRPAARLNLCPDCQPAGYTLSSDEYLPNRLVEIGRLPRTPGSTRQSDGWIRRLQPERSVCTVRVIVLVVDP